ncbi:hypothetical protein M441DRAFT_352605 [Trichoderma asperellum CBS 433.97]|uniref:Uncharacterized protein n=1 Tax=Trichoderma asperellum (strain ATCC 204424 / CBS 433.97 / NBRC 101777) TaxID=1042311 RepID=A0A2T3ZIJ9_TRIA4|nr:hypothetical protein M441DRAFT_352605 [Trichoderma asperellum CBS 433.97]PTB44638.1 hypothetical protein M441DRAFT_352605 [Trichoderma asperellum CBS 433.97]
MAVISKLLPVAAVLLGCVNNAAALAVREPVDRLDTYYRVEIGPGFTKTTSSLTDLASKHGSAGIGKRGQEDHGPDCDCKLHTVYMTQRDFDKVNRSEGAMDQPGNGNSVESDNGPRGKTGYQGPRGSRFAKAAPWPSNQNSTQVVQNSGYQGQNSAQSYQGQQNSAPTYQGQQNSAPTYQGQPEQRTDLSRA